jgi:hypothetical protein
VVEQAAIQAIVLSGSADVPLTVIDRDLSSLCRAVTPPVFVGGQVTRHHAELINAAGAIPLGDDLNAALRGIGTTLARR